MKRGFSRTSNLATLMIYNFKLVKATVLEFGTPTLFKGWKKCELYSYVLTVVYQVYRIGPWMCVDDPFSQIQSQFLAIFDTVNKLLASYLMIATLLRTFNCSSQFSVFPLRLAYFKFIAILFLFVFMFSQTDYS